VAPEPSPTIARPPTDSRFTPGAYITDGQHLYWVMRATVSPVSQRGNMLMVEDCRTYAVLELELQRVAMTCTLVGL
jgi:hypothetical protein